MSGRDYNFPDDFPDLRIPDRTDQPDPLFRPLARTSRSSWREGDRVLAPWEPTFLYVGRIEQIRDDQALIQFDDGDAGWVQIDHIRTLIIQVGQKVLSRQRMGPAHFPAEIREVRGEEVCVCFEDGREEWTRVAALRIPCQPLGPGAKPTKVASHLAFLDELKPGDRVWAHWMQGGYFVGTVAELRGEEALIHFDDGDRGWVQKQQLAPLQIPIGLRVMGRWKMGPTFYPGVVDRVDGDRIHIRYDDGDQEWTRPAALALAGPVTGPDARPARHSATDWHEGRVRPDRHGRNIALPAPASQSSFQMGWLIPVGIAILLLFLRLGCR